MPPSAQQPGRKRDIGEWLQQLHSVGLLSSSFRPAAALVPLRAYMRRRQTLVEEGATHILRIQKALTEMNLMLHVVLSDITGATGLKIARGILDGERDPAPMSWQYRRYAEIIAAGLTVGGHPARPTAAPRRASPAQQQDQVRVAPDEQMRIS